MPPTLINLRILLPSEIFTENSRVSRIVADTHQGSFGLLPHRLDCVAALAPGILVYETESQGESFVAIDEGMLVKEGFNVLISVRRAVAGSDLNGLRDVVQKEFRAVDEQEKNVRSVMAKLEAGFLRRLSTLDHE